MFFRLVVLTGVAALMVSTAPAVAGGLGAGSAKLSPPVIKESFTPLPCSGKPSSRTTLQQEGCAEQQILTTDARINALSKTVFATLRGDLARRRFITAARAWLDYRQAECLSRSDVFEGGSQAPVIDAQCIASLNNQRIKDLRSFLSELRA